MEKLFDYILDCLASGEIDRTESALQTLETLAQAFEAIRTEAVKLENSGQIPAVAFDQRTAVLA